MKKFSVFAVLAALLLGLLTAAPASAASKSYPAVKGEAGCSGMWLWKDCDARDLYRAIYAETKPNSKGQFNDTKMQKAYLLVTSTMSKTSRTDLGSLYSGITSSDAKAKCVRSSLLGFIKLRSSNLNKADGISFLLDNMPLTGVKGKTKKVVKLVYGDAIDKAIGIVKKSTRQTLNISAEDYVRRNMVMCQSA